MIDRRALEHLRCPRCGAPLAADGDAAGCADGHRFDAARGYLDLSAGAAMDDTTRRTFESFGYEWTTYDDVRSEDDAFAEVYFRDLDLDSLHGVALDAGCGKGRYTRYLAPHVEAMIALDGSDAVEAAARNLGGLPGVLVVRADLRDAPVVPGSLDFVSSLGVLHHLADPRAGFEHLADLLAPGGRMLLYLYSRPEGWGARRLALAAARLVRLGTVRLPHPVLRVVSAPIALALWATVVVPGAAGARRGIGALAGLPMAAYRGKPLRSLVLDTFDRLSAPVEHRYVWSDLAPWFEAAGLVVDAARDETGWFVLAHRPAAGADPGQG